MSAAQTATAHLVALDVGERRIGVAVADAQAPFARPHRTLERGATTIDDVSTLIKEHNASVLVVGLPRNLSGEATAQTAAVEQFVAQLKPHIDVPIAWQDEALTSVKAEAELEKRGKAYNKSDVDALAATYILEDYITEHPRSAHV